MKLISVFSLFSLAILLFSSAAHSGPPSRWKSDSAPPPRASEEPEDVSPDLMPVETPGGTVLSPPPVSAGQRYAEPRYAEPQRGDSIGSPRIKSDLPHGWEEPVRVPEGAIPLERVGGRPVAPVQPEAVTHAPPEEFVTEGWEEAPKRPPSRWSE